VVLGLVAVVGAVVRRPPLVWAPGIALVGPRWCSSGSSDGEDGIETSARLPIRETAEPFPSQFAPGPGRECRSWTSGLGLVAVGLTDPFRRTPRFAGEHA